MSYAPLFRCNVIFTVGQMNRVRMELSENTSVVNPAISSSSVSININTAYLNSFYVSGPMPVSAGSNFLSIQDNEPFITKSYIYQNSLLTGNMNTTISPNGNTATLNITGSNGSNGVKINVISACGDQERTVIMYIPSSYKAAPNPVKDILNVEFSNSLVKEALPQKIIIYNDEGNKIFYETNPQVLFDRGILGESNKIKINVQTWPKGVYYLIGYTDNAKTNKIQNSIRLLIN